MMQQINYLAILLFLHLVPMVHAEQTIHEDDIEGIYMKTQTLYGLGGVYVTNISYFFLKNGDVFRKL